MDQNPYQYYGQGDGLQAGSVPPLWVYIATGSVGLMSFGLLVMYFFALVWPLFDTDSLQDRLMSLGTLAVGTLVSFVLVWRTWRRLTKLHQRMEALKARRESLLSPLDDAGASS